MDSDDEVYDDFDGSQEMENEICGKKNSSFEALTTTNITDLMNQYIDDVGSVVKVSFIFIDLLSFDFQKKKQQHQHFESISEKIK